MARWKERAADNQRKVTPKGQWRQQMKGRDEILTEEVLTTQAVQNEDMGWQKGRNDSSVQLSEAAEMMHDRGNRKNNQLKFREMIKKVY